MVYLFAVVLNQSFSLRFELYTCQPRLFPFQNHCGDVCTYRSALPRCELFPLLLFFQFVDQFQKRAVIFTPATFVIISR